MISKLDPKGPLRIELWGKQFSLRQMDRDKDGAGNTGPTGGPRDPQVTSPVSSTFFKSFIFAQLLNYRKSPRIVQ